MLELSEKDFKTNIIKMFQQEISNILKTNKKQKVSAAKQNLRKEIENIKNN